ncbi:hypothetical protein DL93DRAFT_2069694 [Clavulina sp. PMI_390]|nr:hypothetical protein DL93DRAFT_2069694 [Clavulina sp. PMI_390]
MASGALRRRDDFEQFLMGFNQASPLFQMVDVGHGKEVADAKIKDLCTYFARLPQIQSIYLAGGHDGGYATFIRSLTTDGFGKKVVLLRSDTPFARDIAALNQPEVDCRDLFLSSRFTPASGTAGGAVVTPQLHGVNLLVPEPTPVVDSPQASNSPERLCFHFYLWPDGCHDQNCKFKHDMTVSREHVAALAKRLNFAHPPLRAEMLSRTVPPPAYESASMTAIPVANKHVYTPSQELLQEAEGPKPSPTLTVTALSPQLQKTLQPLISVLQKQFKKGTSDVPWCRVADFLKEDHKNYLGRNGVPDTFSAYVTLAKQHGVVSVCSHPKNYNLSTIALTPQWLVR